MMHLIHGGLGVHVTLSAEQNLAAQMKILFAFQFALSKCSLFPVMLALM